MSPTTSTVLLVSAYAAGVVTYLILWRRKKKRIAGHGLSLVPRPNESWSDAGVDKLRAALEAPDHPLEEQDEHEGAFV